MKRLLFWTIAIAIVVFFVYEIKNNSIPFGVQAFDVWVYNGEADLVFLVGSIPCNYHTGDAGLQDCRTMAYNFAARERLVNWSYYCCSVTELDACRTRLQ